MSEKIVQLNEEIIKGQLKELVRGSVEETLNELLEKEAESLTQAARYERSEARQGYRSGHYDRNLTTASSIPMHLSPTMSFTPSKPRPRSHWKKLTQLALSSFMPSAAPKTSRKPSSFTAIATRIATFSYSPPQLRRR